MKTKTVKVRKGRRIPESKTAHQRIVDQDFDAGDQRAGEPGAYPPKRPVAARPKRNIRPSF